MLALLRPWTDLSELKTDAESFEQVFNTFIDAAPKRTKDIVENIQYYHECYDGAKSRRDTDTSEGVQDVGPLVRDCEDGDDVLHKLSDAAKTTSELTEEDIEMAYLCRGAMRERLHAEVALNTAFDHCVFPEAMTHTTFLPQIERADLADLKKFQGWEEQLKAACRREVEEGSPLFMNVDGAAPALTADHDVAGVEVNRRQNNEVGTASARPKRALLNDDQRRAHDIIEMQLQKRLAGEFVIIPVKLAAHQKRRPSATSASNASTGPWRNWQVYADRCYNRNVQSTRRRGKACKMCDFWRGSSDHWWPNVALMGRHPSRQATEGELGQRGQSRHPEKEKAEHLWQAVSNL